MSQPSTMMQIFAPLIIMAALIMIGCAMLLMLYFARRRHERDMRAIRRLNRESSFPCPHCLGTGRMNRKGYIFSRKMYEQYARMCKEEEVPEAFHRAFKE